MKKYYFLSILLLIALSLFSQSVQESIGLVTYRRTSLADGDMMWNGLTSLYFNNEYSVFLHNQAPKSDTLLYFKDLGSSGSTSGDSTGFPIYKMHREKKIIQKVVCRQGKKRACMVSDTFGTILWQIVPSVQKEIGGFTCEKAIGHFRGRDYEAWFTSDIPITSGPFKFGGLPGLILEVYSTDQRVQFLFNSISMNTLLKYPIVAPTGGVDLNMSYSEFMKDWNIFIQKQEKELKAKGLDITISRAELIELNTNN